VPAARIFAWHQSQAEAALEARLPAAVAFHLDRLAAAEPPDHLWRLRRGLLLARLASWERAAADLARVFDGFDPDTEEAWAAYARAQLMRKDVKAYRALRGRLLSLPRKYGLFWSAITMAQICGLGPDTTAEPAQLATLVERLEKRKPEGPGGLFTLGLAHYRARQWDKARARLQEAAAQDREGQTPILPVLAMAHHQLGQADEARRRLDEATTWRTHARRRLAEESPGLPFEGARPDFEILYAEAARLILREEP
jgi:tetratricopeptide (TPR) repeat protein